MVTVHNFSYGLLNPLLGYAVSCLGAFLGLATADDPATALAAARHPPRGELVPRRVTRLMRLGVVGEIRLQGGRAADVVLPPSPWGRGIDWGGAFRARR